MVQLQILLKTCNKAEIIQRDINSIKEETVMSNLRLDMMDSQQEWVEWHILRKQGIGEQHG